MSTRKTHDIVATVGEYTDRNGQPKKRYSKIGAAFTDDQGRISLKLDTVPVSPDWSGWLSLYEPREERQAQGWQSVREGVEQQPQQTTQTLAENHPSDFHRGGSHPGASTDGGEIPF